MEPTRKKNKKQKRLKEGQCLNMDGKLFKTTKEKEYSKDMKINKNKHAKNTKQKTNNAKE
jgi:hypothetical protein